MGHLAFNPVDYVFVLQELSNLYRFVRNNTLLYIDTDGRLLGLLIGGGIAIIGGYVIKKYYIDPDPVKVKNCDGSWSFVVNECEVVVIIGHGDVDKPHLILNASTDTSASGFIGCGASSTNKRIPENRRVPGSPTSREWDGDVMKTEPHYKEARQAMMDGARTKAREICDKKDSDGCPICKKVTVRFEYAPSNNPVVDTLTPALPSNYEVSCGN